MKSRSSTWIWLSTISIWDNSPARSGEKSIATGILDGELAAFGLLRALQVTTTFRLEGIGREPTNSSIDFHGRLADNQIEADATAFRDLQSGCLRASLPVRLEKKQLEAGTAFDRAKPFSLALDCPALFLETLPNEWRAGAERGLLTGTITWPRPCRLPRSAGKQAFSMRAFCHRHRGRR